MRQETTAAPTAIRSLHKAVSSADIVAMEVIHRQKLSVAGHSQHVSGLVQKSHLALRDGGDMKGYSRTSPYRDRARDTTRARSPQDQHPQRNTRAAGHTSPTARNPRLSSSATGQRYPPALLNESERRRSPLFPVVRV